MVNVCCDNLVLLNAHGGNVTPGRQALYDVQLRHRDEPGLWSWMTVAAERIAALEEVKQEHASHAREQETSMILRVRPELVRMEVARGASIPFGSAFYCPDFSAPSRVDVPRAFEGLSETGALGHPEIATAATRARHCSRQRPQR